MGTASASGDGETVGAAVSAGRDSPEGVDVDGNSGLADATSGAGVFVGSGGAIAVMDVAGEGAGRTVAGGAGVCGALIGS